MDRTRRPRRELELKVKGKRDDPAQYGSARHWKMMMKQDRAGKKSNTKDCGKEEDIGSILSTDLYETEMLLQRGGRGEKEELDEYEA